MSNAAPLFLKGGALTDKTYAADREAGLAAAEKEKPLAERLLRSPMLPQPKQVLEAIGAQSSMSVSFFGAAVEARNAELIDEATLKKFCESQLALIDRDTAAAVARRDKSERDWTKRFRSLEDAYRSIARGLATKTA